MDSIDEFETRLASRLAEAGIRRYNLANLLRETRDCRDDIYKDASQHSGDIAEPFFNFVIVEGGAIFTLFDSNFSVYVVPCVESELIVQTNSLAMVDVGAVRDLLALEYGKSDPDAALPRSMGELWLTR
eukprot:TRINITY_DN874_c0_g1_i3.p1 TRINITY_DN874_c0_g1~~TRINITY_DN874_c0_g1_i3.p1  ORF type:complete len:129 (+),score=17.92 TRINITY_DN874_c0_g1_i3:164-550(+)